MHNITLLIAFNLCLRFTSVSTSILFAGTEVPQSWRVYCMVIKYSLPLVCYVYTVHNLLAFSSHYRVCALAIVGGSAHLWWW